jgi:hypothetical protein
MKPSQPTKRPRGHRGNGRRPNGGRNSNFESSGPQGKIRGTAYQVIEKYQALGRDALTFGDRVAAENYFQHAEHYYRVMVANGGLEQRNARPQGQPQNRQPAVPDQENGQQAAPAPAVENADQDTVSSTDSTSAADVPEQKISGEESDLNSSEAESPVA